MLIVLSPQTFHEHEHDVRACSVKTVLSGVKYLFGLHQKTNIMSENGDDLYLILHYFQVKFEPCHRKFTLT